MHNVPCLVWKRSSHQVCSIMNWRWCQEQLSSKTCLIHDAQGGLEEGWREGGREGGKEGGGRERGRNGGKQGGREGNGEREMKKEGAGGRKME